MKWGKQQRWTEPNGRSNDWWVKRRDCGGDTKKHGSQQHRHLSRGAGRISTKPCKKFKWRHAHLPLMKTGSGQASGKAELSKLSSLLLFLRPSAEETFTRLLGKHALHQHFGTQSSTVLRTTQHTCTVSEVRCWSESCRVFSLACFSLPQCWLYFSCWLFQDRSPAPRRQQGLVWSSGWPSWCLRF